MANKHKLTPKTDKNKTSVRVDHDEKDIPTTHQTQLLGRNGVIRVQIPRIIWALSGIIGLLFFALYLYSASPTHVGYAYSDELMATAYNLGLTRPPGYILYTILLHFFMNLPLPVSIAMRGHLLSALMQSISLGLYFVSSWLLIEYIRQNKPKFISIVFGADKDSILISAIATVMIGSVPLVWIYGSIAEVPAFINLLLSWICLISFSHVMSTGSDKKAIYLLLLLTAILFVHNPIFLILLPFILAVIKIDGTKLSLQEIGVHISVFVVTSLLLLFLTFLLSRGTNVLSWYIQPGIHGLWSYFKDNNFNENPLWQMLGKHMLDTIPMYIQVLEKNLGWLLIGLVLIGLRMIFLANKKLFLLLSLNTGLVAIVNPITLSWSADRFTQVLLLRQYAMVMGLFIFPLAVGLWVVLSRMYSAFLVLSTKSKIVKYGIVCLGVIIIVTRTIPLIRDYHFAHLSTFSAIHEQVLRSVPNNALLVCKDDVSCGSLLYAQQVLGINKGVAIVPTQYPLSRNSLEMQKLRGFTYKRNPYVIFDYVSWNVGKRPVYLVGATQTMYDILGMPFGFAYYVPEGYAGEVLRQLPNTLPYTDVTMSNKLEDELFRDDDEMFNQQKDIVSQYHMFNALVYEKMGQRDRARDQLNIGTNLLYDMPDSLDEKIEGYRLAIESLSSVDSWALGTKSQDIRDVIVNIEKSIELKKLNNAYVGAMGAVVLKPDDITTRLLLAKVYELREQYGSAVLEYRHALILDPSNTIAKQKIETLDSK